MKIVTGTLRHGVIELDEPVKLPEATRVKIALQAIGPVYDETQPVVQSAEEAEHVARARGRLGKLTKGECG